MAQQSSPDDIITIQNVDIGCTDIITDVVPTNRKELDTEGKPYTVYEDVTYEMDHSEGFTVRYGGKRFTLKPGEVRRFPRYIAEHIAKALTAHLLFKKEQETKINGLSKDKNEHKKLLQKIFLDVEHIYKEDPLEPGDKAVAEVEALNRPGALDRPVNVGKVDPLGFGTSDTPVKSLDDVLADVPDEVTSEAPEAPIDSEPEKKEAKTAKDFSLKELIETAYNLGIEITPEDKKDKEALYNKIKNF